MPVKDPIKRKIINNKSNQNIRNKRRELIDLHIGKKCIFCSKNEHLISHRKDGIRHKKFRDMSWADFKSEIESNRYARVCMTCHKGIHWCMEFLGMKWENIIK